jgi:hypothetical protein
MAKVALSIPEHVWTHPAYRALGLLERVLLGEMLALAHRVGTDGPIGCSVDMAANMANVRRSMAGRALLSLRKKGFLAIIRSGERRRGATGGMATEWRVTCLPYQGDPPTADYNFTHWKAVDQSAPLPLETSSSNAPARASETASESSELGTGDSKSPLKHPPSGTNIQNLLKQKGKNIVSGKSGMSLQRDNIVPAAGQTEPAKPQTDRVLQ